MSSIRLAPLGAITIACLLTAHARAQATYLSDVRRVSVTSRASAVVDAFSASPQAPFADFEVPLHHTAAAFGDASVEASASHASTLTPNAIAAAGAAHAAGISQGSDPGNAQSSSSFFITFRLAAPQHLVLEATLTRGAVSTAQLVLQSSGGELSYFLDASAPQPIAIDRALPPGDYTLVAYASSAIALYPFASLEDGCAFTLAASLTPLCPADFNRDGFLDFFDYDDFVTCFETGACPASSTADFNQDGFADFFDYDDFVTAYEQGC